MKKKLLLFFLIVSFTVHTNAQDVYNMVLENATRQVNTPTTNFTQTRVAQFKRTALVYIKSKALETMPEVTTRFLDIQAYYLSEFISLFFQEILHDKKLDENARKEKIYMFMSASIYNPLFEDPDKETTQAYINEGSELTPFSLDTNWQKAYYAAKSQL